MCKMFTALCGTVVSHEFVSVSYCHKYYLYFFFVIYNFIPWSLYLWICNWSLFCQCFRDELKARWSKHASHTHGGVCSWGALAVNNTLVYEATILSSLNAFHPCEGCGQLVFCVYCHQYVAVNLFYKAVLFRAGSWVRFIGKAICRRLYLKQQTTCMWKHLTWPLMAFNCF